MAEPGKPAGLKLRATDPEDLSVIAACLQDALVPIGDMTYLPDDRSFVFVANRFRWEALRPAAPGAADTAAAESGDASYHDDSGPAFERTNCAIRFDRVAAVRTKGIDLRNRSQILELLTLHQEGDRLALVFSGGATILLELDELNCALADIGEPWPTQWRPDHPAATGEGPGQ